MSEGKEGGSRRKQSLKSLDTGQKKSQATTQMNRITNLSQVKNIAIAPKPASAPASQVVNTTPSQSVNMIEGIKIGGQIQTLSGHRVVFKNFNQAGGTSEGHQITQIQVPGGGTKFILSSSALIKGLKLNNPTQSLTFNVQPPNIAIKQEPSTSSNESGSTANFNPQISNIMGNLHGKPVILRPIPRNTIPGNAANSKNVTHKVVQRPKPVVQKVAAPPALPVPPPLTDAANTPVPIDVISTALQVSGRSILLPKIPTSQIIKPKVPLILMRRQKLVEPKVESDSSTEQQTMEPSKKPRMLAPKPYIPVSRMCRLCGVPALSTISIFSTQGTKLGLAEKIALHLPIEVKKSDRLPLKVCEQCIALLNVCHEMSVNCAEVNSKLAQQLEEEDRMKADEANNPSFPQPIPILLIENPDTAVASNPPPKGEKSSGQPSTQQPGQSKLRVITDKLIHVDRNLPQPEQIAQVIEAVKAGLGTNQNVSLDSLFKTVVQQGVQMKEEPNQKTENISQGKNFICQMCQEKLPNWFKLIEHQLLKFKCRTCHARFCSTKQRYLHHIKVHHKSKYPCYKCNSKFTSKQELEKHKLKQHPLKCECCNKKFGSKSNLSSHIKIKLAYDCYTCKACGLKLRNKNNYTQHVQQNRCIFRDKGEVFQCSECKRHFRTQNNLNEHKKVHLPDFPKLNCTECDKTFITKVQLNRHSIFHKSKPYKCKMCPKLFTLRGQLSYHMEVHLNERKYQCDFCGQKLLHRVHLIKHIRCKHLTRIEYRCQVCKHNFASQELVEKHLENVHTSEEKFNVGDPHLFQRITDYQCNICKKYMANEPTLMRHLKRHSDQEKGFTLMCEVCGKHFKTRSGLYHHSRTHNDDNINNSENTNAKKSTVLHRYECNQCNLKFGTNAQLTAHYSKHTGVKPFKCSYCEKQFTTKQAKVQHELRHKGIRQHVCEICKKAFYEKYNLRCHMRVHTLDKPYQCSYCPKDFPRRSNLTAHERTHTGVKPYTCVICTHSFTQKSSLDKHMCIHTQEKLYKCIYCSFTCDRRKDLTEHEKSVHKLISNTYATKIYLDEDNPPGVTSIVRDTGEMAYQIQITEEEEVCDM